MNNQKTLGTIAVVLSVSSTLIANVFTGVLSLVTAALADKEYKNNDMTVMTGKIKTKKMALSIIKI